MKKMIVIFFLVCVLIGSVWAPLNKKDSWKGKVLEKLQIKIGGFLKKTGKLNFPKPVIIEVAEPEPVSGPENNYPWHEKIMSTMFWIGEAPSGDNMGIGNDVSAWDEEWVAHYGGYDDPDCRVGYYPCGFVPKENPFYVALPYNDYGSSGERKENSKQIQWYTGNEGKYESLMKNRWVEVTYGEKSCYGQVEDVGPYLSDDFSYVFEGTLPANKMGLHAGIDLSPALRTCLGMGDNEYVGWRFADDVPDGPWKEIITISQVNWK